ncbi:hypothetical protein KLP40_16700 [Hymenobacter sp. NST-14]|uniref:hypothetical protein n=1 Tax=Hymenobacter piscis TaxID=2839984 RepID=UPI001C00BAD1|nr:hypothetical protein [Hymenobacter piscis]MBT9394808.1 hypothetical protein [Hymenobacter piscis]
MAHHYLIRDIVVENAQAAFVSDVQLSWYPRDEHNAPLAASYLWTDQRISKELPSVQALRLLCDNFEFYKPNKNRHTWLATYGHGKSHLALALANFFGQPYESPIVQDLLAGIEHANDDIAQRLRAFKQKGAPHLVVRLRGDRPLSLTQSLIAGLEEALSEHPGTQGAELGLWFDAALKMLDTLDDKKQEEASTYLLDKKGIDLAQLKADIKAHKTGLYDLTRNVWKHLFGFKPDLKGELNPKEMLEQVVKDYCGDPDSGKPCSGILILFDEFGRFVESYAGNYDTQGENLPLQSLLDAMETLRNRAAFVSFTQYKPEEIARRKLQARGAGAETMANIVQELNRLPANQHHALASPLEAVLDGYLQQQDDQWNDLTADDAIWDEVVNAIDLVKLLFPVRYTEANGWTDEKLREAIGKGCFPLHPLTTALLCGASLRGDTARSVLGFVEDRIRAWAPLPALTPDGHLNWVYPIELVAYFGEALAPSETAWLRYDEARRKSPDTPTNRAVLAAMFLFETVGLQPGSTPADEYPSLIGALTGLSAAEATAALQTLAADAHIEYDAGQRKYLFWAVGQSGADATKALNDELNGLLSNASLVEEKLASILSDNVFTDEGHVGNPEAWRAEVLPLSRFEWTAATLADKIARFKYDSRHQSLLAAPRGYVLRAIAIDDADVNWFQEHADQVFQQALLRVEPNSPPPVVLVLPTMPQDGLVKALLKKHLLEGWGHETRTALGEQALQQLENKVDEEVASNWELLWQEENRLSSWYCPAVYQSGVMARLGGSIHPSLQNALKSTYEVAYNRAAPFTTEDQKVNFKRGVARACQFLVRGTFNGWAEAVAPRAEGRARDLYNNYLKNGPKTSWGVIDNREKVREPSDELVKQAWDLLDQAVPAGAERASLRSTLLTLLNVPYGYDYYSLGLLFCAWYGCHRHEVKLYRGATGPSFTPDEWLGDENNFQNLISSLLGYYDVCVTRIDKGKVESEVAQLVEAINDGKEFSQVEADNATGKLTSYLSDPAADESRLSQVQEAIVLLDKDRALATDYHNHLLELQKQLTNNFPANLSGVKSLATLLEQVRQKPDLGCLKFDQPELVAEIEQAILSKLGSTVMQASNILARLTSLEKHSAQLENLTYLRIAVNGTGHAPSMALVKQATDNLASEHRKRTEEAQDLDFIEKLEAAEKAEKQRRLSELRFWLPVLELQQVFAESTEERRQKIVEKIQKGIQTHKTFLANAQAKAAELTTRTSVASLLKSLYSAQADYQEAEPEQSELTILIERCESFDKVLKELEDLKNKKAMDGKELATLLKNYDTLAADACLSETQRQFVLELRNKKEAKFNARVQKAVEELIKLEARSTSDESPALVMDALRQGRHNGLRFLPTDHQSRLKAVEGTLNNRIGEDATEKIQDLFLCITNLQQRRQCYEKLRDLLALPSSSAREVPAPTSN